MVDNIFITITLGDLESLLIKIYTLRENNLYLISYKQFVQTNTETDE